MTRSIFCFLTGPLLVIALESTAQSDVLMLQQSLKKDTAIKAVALYPLEVRNNILMVCAHPEGLLKMESMQKNSEEQFRKILSAYPEEDQKKLWDLARYQDLVEKLAGSSRRKKKIEAIVKEYPEEIRETAAAYRISHHDALVRINALNKSLDKDFATIIKDYPPAAQNAFKELLRHPEAIALLGDNMHMTVLWGDIYKRDPILVKNKLDSLGNELAAQNAKSLKDWKEGLEKDPRAKQEFEAAAKEYAASEGYSEDELVIRDTRVVEAVVHPYPYWFGTPWWWDYPRWYPYPYWYDWGFYYGPYGIVYIGYPSWYFTYWYFHHPHHHYDHPYFSNYCIGHYYGHRGSYTGVHRGVSGWVLENRGQLPNDFLTNEAERPARLKDLGKLGMDYQQYQREHTGKRAEKDEFLRTYSDRYPHLRPVTERAAPKPAPDVRDREKPLPETPQPRPEAIPRHTPAPAPRPKTQEQPRIKTTPPSPRIRTQPPRAPKPVPAPRAKPKPPRSPRTD